MKTSKRILPMAIGGLLAIQSCLYAQTGLTSETWNNLTKRDSIIVLQQEGISTRPADVTGTVTNASISSTITKSGTRLRGTVTPAITDTYTFWVSGNSNVALWISDDASRFKKKLVCYNLNSTTAQSWDQYPTQKSLPIQLTGGQSYYLEAQVMDENGGGHLSVAWRGQSGRYALDLNGATATQSSTKWGKNASAVIDGDTGGVWGQNATSLTNSQLNSWLQVDLGQDREINQVVLYNMSTNQNRLSNFRLSVLDANNVELIGQNFFTTTGNVGNSMTWDLPNSLPNARKIKIQLLGYNRAGNGELALAEIEVYGNGLTSGQVAHRQIIPQAVLNSIVTDPLDTNDNNLNDAWENQTGLSASAHAEALREYGDPDGDGISNYQEQWFDSNPLVQENVGEGLTRYIWMGINGSIMTNLTQNMKFYSHPNKIDHVPGVNDYSTITLHGSRYRGALIAPVTGAYTFWISGNGGGVQLWLADGSVVEQGTSNRLINRFGKKLLASSNYVTPYQDFDYTPEQRSVVVHLEEGEQYYVEVLQAIQNSNKNHVQVAWEYPGQARQIIPAMYYLSNLDDAGDKEDDNLPDTWEISKGLDPTRNGYNDLNQSEYGDPDADGLTNLREYQLGTHPKNRDTDGDGFSDGDEINQYGSDPLVSNNIVTTFIGSLNLQAPVNSSVPYENKTNGSILAHLRRGWTDWNFTVQPGQEGAYEVRLKGGAEGGAVRSIENLPISFHLNGDLLGRKIMECRTSPSSTTIAQKTPWLSAGTYTLRIQNHNARANVKLRIDAIDLYQIGGHDLDGSGIADWIETKFFNDNQLVRIPSQSRTSPAFVEGKTSTLTTLELTHAVADGAPEQLDAHRSVDTGFFANIPLHGSENTTLNVSYGGGVFTSNHSITWIETNVLDTDSLIIRKGDSLRITAFDPALAAEGTYTLEMSQGGPSLPSGPHDSNAPLEVRFETAGTYTLTATWMPQGGGNPIIGSLIVNVRSADFGDSFVVQTYNRRTWNVTGAGGTNIESDSGIVFRETTTAGNTGRNFLIETYTANNYNVIARVPETGEIIAVGDIHAFSLSNAITTGDAQIIERRADGSSVVRFSIVAENFPTNAKLRLYLNYSGSTFSNGSRELFLMASDFSSNGIANIIVESSSITPQVCHNMAAHLMN